VTSWNLSYRPLSDAFGWLSSSVTASMISSVRRTRSPMREPVTSNSRVYQPGPTPNMYRPPDRCMSVAISFASTTGCRTGSTRMPVASVTFDVSGAANASVLSGSSHAVLYRPGAESR
jgi:hypothetical protein